VTATLAERLRSGDPLVGTVLSLPGVALAELAAAPFDLVWIDLEHGALGVGEAQELAVAAQGAGCAALVRLPRWDWERLPAVLDAGVDGVVGPAVETPAQAAALAARLRYPPGGRRGYGPRRAARAGSPAAPALVVQIESATAVEAAPAIAAVPGVDALVIGAADLSFDLGAPLDLDAIAPAAAAVREAARSAGIGFGVAGPGDPEALSGSRPSLLVGSVDVRVYAKAADDLAAALRAALAPMVTRG
jgi:2-keto-3-deoxy-L-rhamnonate aldolase RhmA